MWMELWKKIECNLMFLLYFCTYELNCNICF